MERPLIRENRELLKTPSFKAELDGIVSTPLSPENIDTYADDALEQLITLTRQTVESYDTRPTIAFDSTRDREEAAFGYFGLENVEAILDHIADKADEMNSIDEYISNLAPVPSVILPAGELQVTPFNGERTGTKENREIPRLKTLLFVLRNDFAIDLDDPKQVSVKFGTNDPSMVRRYSYYSVVLPQIDRQILINDELGNITYVLDSRILADTVDQDVTSLTKQELDSVIEGRSGSGKRVIYNQNFVTNLIAAINDPGIKEKHERPAKVAPSYLLPEETDGYIALKDVALLVGRSPDYLKKIVLKLSDELGHIATQKLQRGQPVRMFTPEQVAVIETYIIEKTNYGHLPPEGYVSNTTLAKRHKLSFQTIYKATEEMKTAGLIEPELYLFATTRTNGYSLDEQDRIAQYLEDNEYLIGQAPEGYLSIGGLRNLYSEKRSSGSTFKRVIDQLGDKLGAPSRYRFGAKVTDAYSPDQVRMIVTELQAQGHLRLSKESYEDVIVQNFVPEGYESISGIADSLKFSFALIERVLNQNSDRIGDPLIGKTRATVANYYSPEQQATIKDILTEEGHYAEKAPEGYVTIAALKRRYGVWERLINREINAHKEEVGEPTIYKVGSRPEETYDSRQQTIIETLLNNAGLLNPVPPEGILNRLNLAEKWGINYKTVDRAAGLSDLGDVRIYKFRTHNIPGYDSEQQAKIYQTLIKLGAFNPEMPEGYATRKQISEEFGGSVKKIQRIMDELGIMGTLFKYNDQVTVCLSEDEQRSIARQW